MRAHLLSIAVALAACDSDPGPSESTPSYEQAFAVVDVLQAMSMKIADIVPPDGGNGNFTVPVDYTEGCDDGGVAYVTGSATHVATGMGVGVTSFQLQSMIDRCTEADGVGIDSPGLVIAGQQSASNSLEYIGSVSWGSNSCEIDVTIFGDAYWFDHAGTICGVDLTTALGP